MDFTKSFEYLEKAKKLIPSITQTFSRAPSTFVEGAFPVYAQSAKGSHFTDVDGNEFIDYVCGLGPIILGHAYPSVNESIKNQIDSGILFSLPHKLEIDLSELLCKVVPCSDMVKFSKTGSGSATGAIRAARAITKREKIAYCGSGGVWHDWYASIISRNIGVPKFNETLILPFEYNNISTLEYIFENNKDEIACVFMEPTILERPNDGFLKHVKKLAHDNDSILIFDEIVTGFRFSNGGAQELFDVLPDIAVLGKGIANGMPLSAVVGKQEFMKIFDDVFFSTTYASDVLSLSGGLATVTEFVEKPVVKTIWSRGESMMEQFNQITKENSLDIHLKGYPVRMNLQAYDKNGNDSIELRSLVIQEMLQHGIFMHHAVEYISFSHTVEDINSTITALEKSVATIKKAVNEDNVSGYLKGKPCKPVYSVLKRPMKK